MTDQQQSTTQSGTRITIRRPNGETEIVFRASEFYTTARQQLMRDATRKAGRGEIVSFETISPARSLESQRRDLVAAVQGWADEVQYTGAVAADSDGASAIPWQRRDGAIDRLQQAERELAAFDTAHPEIVAAIRAERQAATERFLRQD